MVLKGLNSPINLKINTNTSTSNKKKNSVIIVGNTPSPETEEPHKHTLDDLFKNMCL